MRSALRSIAWPVGCASFLGLLFAIDLDLNFFDWTGGWHLQGVASLIGVLALLIGAYFLSSVTTSTATLTIAAVSCVILFGFGIYSVTPEPLGNAGEWFSRRSASPAWYRWGRLALTATPLAIIASSRVFGRPTAALGQAS